MNTLLMACEHTSIIYDGTKPVVVDAKFRSDYGLRAEVRIPDPIPSGGPGYEEYLELRGRRHLQIAEEVDALILAAAEEKYVEPPVTKGRPFPTGDNVAEILSEMETNPGIRHYLMAPIEDDEEEADEVVSEPEMPVLKRTKTNNPHRTPIATPKGLYNPHRTPHSGDTMEF